LFEIETVDIAETGRSGRAHRVAGAWAREGPARGSTPPGSRSALALRARIVHAMVCVVSDHGFQGASVRLVCERARVSRRAFHECFRSPEDCMQAALELALGHEQMLIAQAFDGAERWEDGLRGALLGTLEFLDAEPELARTAIVEALAAGPAVRAVRERVAEQFRAAVVARIEHEVPFTWPLAAEAMFASVIGVVYAHLTVRHPQPLVALLAPLMTTLLAPFSDAGALGLEVARSQELAHSVLAARTCDAEAARERHADWAGAVLPASIDNPRARRRRECLSFLAAHPGASNRAVAEGVGIGQVSQVSRVLAHLAGQGLAVKRTGGPGRPNAWWLTPRGQRAASVICGQS
jgi:AcrR family transcriptional regulator